MDIKQKINVAGVAMEVYVDKKFSLIQKFFARFGVSEKQKIVATVRVSKDTERKVEVSKDFNQLLISGDDIDDLINPFNFIGITQALFRFSAIHLAKQGILLLHGSASSLDDKIICFGDDGESTAKTLSSLETAFISNHYVADEFCFFDTTNNHIFGYSFIPLHIRPIVRDHLETCHSFILPPTDYVNNKAGYFIEPNKLFNLTSGKLDRLVYVHFSETENRRVELSVRDALKSFKMCATAHVAKLLYPELDRMQFASRTDSTSNKIIKKEIIDEIEKRIFPNQSLIKFGQMITSCKLIVSDPCRIIPFFKVESLPEHL